MALKFICEGHEVRVATSSSGGVSGNKNYKKIEIYYYPWKGFFGHPVPSNTDLQEHVRWADLVHTATYTAAPVAMRAAKVGGKPCYITVYECLGRKWFWIENPIKAMGFFAFEYWVLHKGYDKYIAISKATKRDLLASGIDSSKVMVIYPELEKTKTIGKAIEGDYYLYFGRPGKTKGIFVLLKAIIQYIGKLGGKSKFLIVLASDPPKERARFVSAIKGAGLGNQVSVIPSMTREDLQKTILRAKAVIVPSITEGFGYSAVEACELGKKVIVSDAGSLPEVVFGKVLFFKNRNYLDLASKIVNADNDKFSLIKKRL